MRAATRTLIRNLALAVLAADVAVLLLRIPGDLGEIALIALLLVAFALGAIWWLSTPTAAHEAPDVLGEEFDSYFEGDGLCFNAGFAIRDGVCWVHVVYQNRYNAGCAARIYLVPMEGWSPQGLNDVPPVVADVECGGGDVGVVHIPYPIASAWQGKVMIYDVMAQTVYPGGRGELVRRNGGVLVDPPSSKSDAAEALETAAWLMVGFVRLSNGRRGKLEVTLPQDVADALPAGVAVEQRLIAAWDPPTGGFPVS